MEEMYYYIEDFTGGFIVDEYYMENNFDPKYETFMFNGSIEEIEDYIKWLCNDEEE